MQPEMEERVRVMLRNELLRAFIRKPGAMLALREPR